MTVCPKCGYQRTSADANPAWQCPSCHVAYAKFTQRLAAGGRELAHEASTDRSVYSLIAVNVLAIVVGAATGASLREMMLVYWIQSVIIGVSFFFRILSWQRYANEAPPEHGMEEENPRIEQQSFYRAIAFALPYGFVHFLYLVFLKAGVPPSPAPAWIYWLCGAAFAVNHGYSLLVNIAADRRGIPRLNRTLSVPYMRIFPMHFTLIAGALTHPSTAALVLFCGLKTLADVVMHSVEHHTLRS